MINEPNSHTWLPVLISIIGWPVTAYIGYRLGLRSKRLEREWAVHDAISAKRSEFIHATNLIKTTINTSNNDPAVWVNFFKDNAAVLLALYTKAGIGFQADEKPRIADAMKIITKFANMEHGDIYTNAQELCDALNKISEE